MKTNIIFLVVFVACVIFGNNVVESWWSFLGGAVFALAVRDVGKELIERAKRR